MTRNKENNNSGLNDKYTISPGNRGSMAKSRPVTAARGPQARGLPWRAEMQPNCPATRRDCVYHHGTDTRLEQVKLEKIELEKKAF